MTNEQDPSAAASSLGANQKLVPELKASSDTQTIVAGLLVLLLLVGGLLLAGGLSGDDDVVVSDTVEVDSGGSSDDDDEVEVDLAPQVSAAVAGFAGVNGTANGSTATLTGFIDNAAQSDAAEAAAATVPGIENVDNQLVNLDTAVLEALNANGVDNAAVTVDGLVATVTGELDSEDQRQPALDAAANVAGVASVVDQLTVSAPAEAPEPEVVDLAPDVSAAVAGFAGVSGTADGTTAVLTGSVESADESAAAEAAAAAVAGITDVDNQLTIDAPEPEIVDLAPDVSAAVDQYEGVTGTAIGTTAVLSGFVDNAEQSEAAEAAAAAVPGIEEVDNQLVAIDADVIEALSANGVTDAAVSVDGLVATVSGELESEDQRQPALDAAADVDGVASVIDELTVAELSLTESLNALVELEPVQFATSSSDVLTESADTLDRAAEIILASDDTSAIEVQGYTDIRGSEQGNLDLSNARAAAVVQELIDRDVPADRLTSVGFGGTTEFGVDDEDFAANRRVVFVPAA